MNRAMTLTPSNIFPESHRAAMKGVKLLGKVWTTAETEMDVTTGT